MARNPDLYTKTFVNQMNSAERAGEIRQERQKNKIELQGKFEDRAALEKVIQGTWGEKSALQRWQDTLRSETERRGQDVTARGQDVVATTAMRGQDFDREFHKDYVNAQLAETASKERVGMAPHKYDDQLAPLGLADRFGISSDKANAYLNAGPKERQAMLDKWNNPEMSARDAFIKGLGGQDPYADVGDFKDETEPKPAGFKQQVARLARPVLTGAGAAGGFILGGGAGLVGGAPTGPGVIATTPAMAAVGTTLGGAMGDQAGQWVERWAGVSESPKTVGDAVGSTLESGTAGMSAALTMGSGPGVGAILKDKAKNVQPLIQKFKDFYK
jgi:hypothetical protein